MLIVVKIGGSLQDNMVPALHDAILTLQAARMHVAVVHGGGPAISKELAKQNMILPFHNGIRITPPEAMPIVESALWSHVNHDLATRLAEYGIGVSRVNGAHGLFHVASTPMMRTGQIKKVVPSSILQPLQVGKVPLICPLGVDENGLHYNINADVATAHLANALGAQKVIFCTDVSGIYADFDGGIKLYETTSNELSDLLANHKFTNGMIPKVEAALTTLSGSTSAVYVIDGRSSESLTWAICDNPHVSNKMSEMGTRIVAGTTNHLTGTLL